MDAALLALALLAKAGWGLDEWKPALLWHMTRDEFLFRDFLVGWLYPNWAAGAHRLRPEELAELEELVRPEVVVLGDASPVGVDDRRPRIPRSDPVLPMVLVGEASARPAEDGYFHLPQGFYDIGTVPVNIGNFRIRSNPDPVINASAKVFGKMAVDIAVDGVAGLAGMNDEYILRPWRGAVG